MNAFDAQLEQLALRILYFISSFVSLCAIDSVVFVGIASPQSDSMWRDAANWMDWMGWIVVPQRPFSQLNILCGVDDVEYGQIRHHKYLSTVKTSLSLRGASRKTITIKYKIHLPISCDLFCMQSIAQCTPFMWPWWRRRCDDFYYVSHRQCPKKVTNQPWINSFVICSFHSPFTVTVNSTVCELLPVSSDLFVSLSLSQCTNGCAARWNTCWKQYSHTHERQTNEIKKQKNRIETDKRDTDGAFHEWLLFLLFIVVAVLFFKLPMKGKEEEEKRREE